MEKKWFKRKLYGWVRSSGATSQDLLRENDNSTQKVYSICKMWTPTSWEGWLVILVWAVLFTFGMIKMDHEGLKNLFFIFIFTGLLIYICYKKGEKPKWQWGKRIEDDK